MNKIERYKNLYPDPNGVEELVLNSNGSLDVPKWLALLLLHDSGLRTKKKRKVKKRLKQEIIRMIKYGMLR